MVAASTTSTELVASDVATTPGEDVGIMREATEVLTAATSTEEVARRAELEVVFALHADFLDEVMVEFEKWVKLEDGLAMVVTPPAALEATDEAALVTTGLELATPDAIDPADVVGVTVAEPTAVCEMLAAPE